MGLMDNVSNQYKSSFVNNNDISCSKKTLHEHKAEVSQRQPDTTNLNNSPLGIYNRALYSKLDKTLEEKKLDPKELQDARKAGHELGISYKDKQGNFFVYDKTDSKWLYDKKTTKIVRKLDEQENIKNAKIKSKYINHLKKRYDTDYLNSLLIGDEYAKIRSTGSYKKNYGKKNITGNKYIIQKAIEGVEDSDGVCVSPYANKLVLFGPGYFIYRGYVSDPVERLSLNVSANENLIKELDILCSTGKYINSQGKISQLNNMTPFSYKTPAEVKNWGDREDPITLYFKHMINDETYSAIVDITKKYARGSLNYPVSSVTPWIGKELYVTDEMVKNLLQKAKNVDKKIYNLISSYCSGYCSGGSYNMSTGQYNAMDHVVNEYTDYLKLLNGEEISFNEDFAKLNS